MKKQNRFWWFDGDAFDKIRREIIAAPAGARLEVHIDFKTDDAIIFIESPEVSTEEGGGGTNQSHVCPPVCP